MDTENDTAPQAPSELEMLKNRANLMGISYSNNIKIETLKAKIQAKIDGESQNEEPTDDENTSEEVPAALATDTTPEAPETAAPTKPETKPETKAEMRQRLVREATKLVRLRIQNLNPNKRDLPGEIFTAGNEVVGTIKKFIPYGEVTENGYHVPHILYEQMLERKFLNIRTAKKAGQIQVKTGWVPEFALEVLPPLTQDELARLAAAQAAAGGLGDD